jgi:23S rRNA (adenine2503-C2)-methyltransferase
MKQAVDLPGLSKAEVVSFLETIEEPAYRGRQVFAGLQHRRLRSFNEMSDLPTQLRARLNEVARASTLTIESRYVSSDGTRRYLMKTHDNLPVETVFIPEERRDTDLLLVSVRLSRCNAPFV